MRRDLKLLLKNLYKYRQNLDHGYQQVYIRMRQGNYIGGIDGS